MFEDSLTESSKGFKGLRRAGATVLLLAMQVAIVASLIVVPILDTEALSAEQMTLTPRHRCRLGDPGIRPVYWEEPKLDLDPKVCDALEIIAARTKSPEEGLRRKYECWRATPRVVTSDGVLVHRVVPVYPTVAKTARIQGHVVFEAIIGKDGRIESLRVISGHPMLVYAALEAVRQWKYRPYLLNNEPVEVETRIDVNFALSK